MAKYLNHLYIVASLVFVGTLMFKFGFRASETANMLCNYKAITSINEELRSMYKNNNYQNIEKVINKLDGLRESGIIVCDDVVNEFMK